MAGGRLLIRRCDVVVTMDDDGIEIPGGSILVEDGVIRWVGSGDPPEQMLPRSDDRGIDRTDGSGTVAIPGLVNTHHHMYQVMTRAHAQEESLFGWLVEQYPIWAGVDAAWEPGMRFPPCRGSMDLSEKDGGLPPDSVVQDTDTVLAETEAAVKELHDPSPGSMLRIAVAPCSPFSVTDRLMRESVDLARRLGVRLHTHIAETLDEEEHCVERFGRRPIDLLEDQGFVGDDVWLAHCVHMSDADVARLAATGTGAAWCPASNLRIGSGIARVRDMIAMGVGVGLGVDGSASNDTGHLLGTARIGLLSARAPRDGGMGDPGALTVRDVLRIATRGGASCLGWGEEVGSLEAGKRADIALVPVDGLAFAGAERDLVAGVLLCAPPRVRHLFVEGRAVVRDGRLANADEDEIAAEGRRIAARVVAAEVRG